MDPLYQPCFPTQGAPHAPSVTYAAALSLLPTPGSDDFFKNDSPAGAIAGALVGVMVIVVENKHLLKLLHHSNLFLVCVLCHFTLL